MRDKFGDEWYELMADYFDSKDFLNISKSLKRLYAIDRKIIPTYKSPLFFKVFRDLQPSDIKVIILGQDPYPQKGIYTGYAFDNANSTKLSKSLQNVFKEVDNTYPENYYSLEYGNLDRWDLSRWMLQGVFLVNTALSVVEDKPGSHLSMWKPFTVEWISRLSEYKDDIVWLLWGNGAQRYEEYIQNPSHRVIKTGHPSPLNTYKPFVGSNCFVDCNEDLIGRNKGAIIW